MGSREKEKKKASSLQGRAGLFRRPSSKLASEESKNADRKSSAPDLLGRHTNDTPVIIPREFQQGEILFTVRATNTIKVRPYPDIIQHEPFSICHHDDTDTNRLFIQIGNHKPQFMPRSVILSALNKDDLKFDYLECVDVLTLHPALLTMLFYEDKFKVRFALDDTVALFISKSKIPLLLEHFVQQEDEINGEKNTLFRNSDTPLPQTLKHLLKPEHNQNMKIFLDSLTDFLITHTKNLGRIEIKDVGWLTKQYVDHLASLEIYALPKELLYVIAALTPAIRKKHSESETQALLGGVVMLTYIVPAIVSHQDIKRLLQITRALQLVSNHKSPTDADEPLYAIRESLQSLFPVIDQFNKTLSSGSCEEMPFDTPASTTDAAIRLYNCLVLNQFRLGEQEPGRIAIENIVTRVAKLNMVREMLDMNIVNQSESKPQAHQGRKLI